jgi:DNA-binding XRE family transcriptional regulator
MEYKSSMFRADTKYSGNHLALTAEIEKKLVEDKESSSRKGVLQLAEAVQTLFGVNASTVLPGINLTKIKHV